MKCELCITKKQEWNGSAPICAFSDGAFSVPNWNCWTANLIRDICYEGDPEMSPLVDYRYCNDMKYATICIDDLESIEGRPMALWVSWYKNRGETDAMWLLFDDFPPRQPTEAECLAICEFVKLQGARR